MSADARHTAGRLVEQAACVFLQSQGMTLVDRNVRCRGGEVDLVMRHRSELVFVEVRYRSHQGFGGGAASVDAHKQRRLALAAHTFLQRNPQLAALPCRFDVVEAEGQVNAPRLNWLRAAFSLA